MKRIAASTAAIACTLAIPVASAQDARYPYRYQGPAPPNYRNHEARPRSYPIPDPAESRYYYRPAPRLDPDPAPAAPEPTWVSPEAPLAPPPAPRIAEFPPAPSRAKSVPKNTATPSRAPKVPMVASLRTERYRLAASELFELDQATIRGDTGKLDEIAAMLRSDEPAEVTVIGHTDKLGDKAFNLKLSQRRAEAVRDYLVRKGVPPSRLKAVGRGEEAPVVYCGDDGGEWEWEALNKCLEPNRRIEVERVTPQRGAPRRS